ncbi:MAG: RecX family transcriptional regulator [Chitinophagaceae bacterium]|nr:RecX family transcriptional regulator [Chitinophagaceae bacterium]
MGKTPYLSPEQAWSRARQFCSYRERCHSEVREKLYALGLFRKDVEALIARLIEEDLLNEERFARLFAGRHFRQKKWGRVKIVHALRQKKLSETLIRLALKEIEATDYTASLQKLAAAKWEALKQEQYITRQAKTRAYLLQKGFEAPAVQQAIAALSPRKKI